MAPPFRRSGGQFASSFSHVLNLPVGGAVVDDCAIVYVEGVDWFSGNAGGPVLPSWLTPLEIEGPTASGFKVLAYGRVPDGLGRQITLFAGPGMTTAGGWWGWVDIIGDVSWRQGGWIDIPGTAGDYATRTASDFGSAITQVWVEARVSVDALGVAHWFWGWASGDGGFGLNSSNRPILFVNNTLGNPIGNAAANADIPGLVAGETIWVRGILTVSTAEITYWYSRDPSNEVESVGVHWTALGTAVTGTNAGTTVRLTNTETTFIGARDAATTPTAKKVYAIREVINGSTRVHVDFSDDLPGSVALVGGDVGHFQPTGDNLPGGSPFEFWRNCFGFCYSDPPAIYIPEMTTFGEDRFGYHVWRGGRFASSGPHTTGPIEGPAIWHAYPDRAGQVLGLLLKAVSRARVDDDFPQVNATSDGAYSWAYHQFAFVGLDEPVAQPLSPQPTRTRLGCAESYNVFITDDTYERVIERVQWSALNWGRVLDDVSQAGATIPDALGGLNCLAHLGGLMPWAYGMLIERNDAEVWRGPVVRVGRRDDTLVVGAADSLIRYQKRFLLRDVAPKVLFDGDAAVLFKEVIDTHARVGGDSWTLGVPAVSSGVTVQRALRPREFKYAWDLIGELLDHAIDAFMMNGVLYMWEPGTGWRYHNVITRTLDGPYNVNADFVYGTFTEDAWSTRPDWSIDGMEGGNFVAVPNADSGQEGFRDYEYAENTPSQATFGVLDHVATDTLELPEDATPSEVSSANLARARSLVALRGVPPLTMEGGTLSENAPIDMDNLRPGSLWKMDVFDSGFGQLLTIGRLRRVEVTVRRDDKGITETVSPVLEPPGQEGAAL